MFCKDGFVPRQYIDPDRFLFIIVGVGLASVR